ncbi:homoserine O-acetyltransferase [Nonlabens sp. Hel1_33_55]|uniref:alpha/beta fold hydrolase n=1 Tax=Nonlabens sp. Hel1_33_55 TaxID=1336802 RepID=UPI000875CCA6|nr:alpha/beta fold hydrolase [Nonlabens sp. Hel1_33_55]SCY43329.1 homoserine O-acetyltransferase [Nonlabens sp. Hel1_33_55]
MSGKLQYISIPDLQLRLGKTQEISVSYQIFGRELHTAPIILVNHALTGNSSIDQWWEPLVGSGKVLDTDRFTLLAFDIPGNGYDGSVDRLIYNFQEWCLADVALAFAKAIQHLNIKTIDLGIGGSIGGALLWEMMAIEPKLFRTIVPIAADWKATDWLIACCHVQESILNTSSTPLEVARQHAMTFYRSPQGLGNKFHRQKIAGSFAVNNWLDFHGKTLEQRFSLPAYQLLNHLLASTDAALNHDNSIENVVLNSDTTIEMIAVDSDGFFVAQEDRDTYELLKNDHEVAYHEIVSLHGHDAFLIEHDQVKTIVSKIMKHHLKEVNA